MAPQSQRLFKIFVYLFIPGFLSVLFFYLYTFASIIPPEYHLHYYNANDLSINTIVLKVFYFVPSDHSVDPAWKSAIEDALKKAQIFHAREFKGYSVLKYQIYTTPIQGNEPLHFYEREDTLQGSEGALDAILKEITARVFTKEGDLYNEDFAKQSKQDFVVKVLVYEGSDISSGHLSVLLAKDYLKMAPNGASILYHEFLRNLGVTNSYDRDSGAPFSDDIMGNGEEKPIMETYIRDEIKRALGYNE